MLEVAATQHPVVAIAPEMIQITHVTQKSQERIKMLKRDIELQKKQLQKLQVAKPDSQSGITIAR